MIVINNAACVHKPTDCVLTIGKFESIHLGHRALLAEVIRQAKALGLKSAAMVFEPHPYIFLNDARYKPLFTEDERNHLLADAGLDYVFYFPFDEKFAALPPKDFCKKIFDERNAKLVVVGENYRFGKGRVGDVELLQKEAAAYGAAVQVFALQVSDALNSVKISTSGIRQFIAEGKLAEANCQLGFPFFIMGTVAKRKQLGRTIGFPTLNMYPPDEKYLPPDGVYATNSIIGGVNYRSITNIGLRPTVDNTSAVRSVETHLFGYAGKDLYDEYVKIELLEFIRPERRFGSLEELKARIAEDVMQVQVKYNWM